MFCLVSVCQMMLSFHACKSFEALSSHPTRTELRAAARCVVRSAPQSPIVVPWRWAGNAKAATHVPARDCGLPTLLGRFGAVGPTGHRKPRISLQVGPTLPWPIRGRRLTWPTRDAEGERKVRHGTRTPFSSTDMPSRQTSGPSCQLDVPQTSA